MDLEALQNLRSALAFLARRLGQGAIPCHNHWQLPCLDSLRRHSQKSASLVALFLDPLLRVTRRAGQEVSPERMFWMKASDKTIATNAYVSGFGASKRIVIWDTAIAQESADEVVADFGHEMGHYALGHIWKGFAFLAALLFVLLYLGYRTI